MTMRRLPPLAALLAVLAVAGCGSGSNQPTAADAKTSYGAVRTEIVGLGRSIGSAISAAPRETDAQLAAAFTALAARGDAAVARLRALGVPSTLTADRDALSSALEAGTGDLTNIARAARASDASAARAAAVKLVRDSAKIRTARSAFEQSLDAAAK